VGQTRLIQREDVIMTVPKRKRVSNDPVVTTIKRRVSSSPLSAEELWSRKSTRIGGVVEGRASIREPVAGKRAGLEGQAGNGGLSWTIILKTHVEEGLGGVGGGADMLARLAGVAGRSHGREGESSGAVEGGGTRTTRQEGLLPGELGAAGASSGRRRRGILIGNCGWHIPVGEGERLRLLSASAIASSGAGTHVRGNGLGFGEVVVVGRRGRLATTWGRKRDRSSRSWKSRTHNGN
jgi:hypothetical protein